MVPQSNNDLVEGRAIVNGQVYVGATSGNLDDFGIQRCLISISQLAIPFLTGRGPARFFRIKLPC